MAENSQDSINVSSSENALRSGDISLLTPRLIAGEVMLLLISLVTIYIFVALMHYSWRFRHMARVSGSEQELRERYLHYSCAALIFIAITRCILHQVVVFLPKGPDDLNVCGSMMIASRVVYNLAICLTYVHLWLRQHMSYTKEELQQFRTKTVKVLDWSVLAIIICTSAVLAFIAFIPMGGDEAATIYHRDKCNMFVYTTKLFLFLYAGLSLVYQLILLVLYVYPIIQQKIGLKTDTITTQRKAQTLQISSYPALWRGIRRGFILTVVVIITDAISGVLVWFLTKEYPEMLSSIIALNDVNLIVNVICCICTFRNWRKIVFGFAICRRMGWHHDDLIRSGRRNSKRTAGMPGEETSVTSDKAIGVSETNDDKRMLGRVSI